ncbi:MAG: arginine deiminase [Cyclobacteriaceae bacterium]|nr:arginine deiminase [Cyclobacteriaceae bacterium]
MKLKLNSEFGTLRRVIMHRPGQEIERLTPQNSSELLFEDVPYLESMQKEHDEFFNVIKSTTDAMVYRLRQLLLDVVKQDVFKESILLDALARSSHEEVCGDIMSCFSTAEIVTMLIAGIRADELKRKVPALRNRKFDSNYYIIHPSPNMYFMRDPAAVTQNGVISSNMKFSGRQFESHLLKLIFKHHPDFKDAYHEVFPGDDISTIPTIEGGDVMVISPKVLAIGCSERTESAAIEKVAKNVLSGGIVERVYEVKLPGRRNYMHLDTVFTVVDENLVVTYPEAIDSLQETYVHRISSMDNNRKFIMHKEAVQQSLITILKNEISHLEVIETGYGHPDHSSREQWYDGANVFALGPRRVISYDRNKHTNRALRDRGVDVIEIRSSELSRGLGGPRCMTMPIERDDI